MVVRGTLRIEPSELNRFTNDVFSRVQGFINKSVDKLDTIMLKQIDNLTAEISKSGEFRDLKTPTLIGKFGFTPSELSKIDEMLKVISRDKSISNIRKRAGNITMEWVDFEQLKAHQVAEHPLTKLNADTGGFEETGTVVSWIEWWEEGVTIRGHIFTRGNVFNEDFSRSGFGLMQTRNNSLFMLQPTRIFERVSRQKGPNTVRNITRAFERLLRREFSG